MSEGESVLPPTGGNSCPDILVVGSTKKWPEVGMLPNDRLDASTLNWGPK